MIDGPVQGQLLAGRSIERMDVIAAGSGVFLVAGGDLVQNPGRRWTVWWLNCKTLVSPSRMTIWPDGASVTTLHQRLRHPMLQTAQTRHHDAGDHPAGVTMKGKMRRNPRPGGRFQRETRSGREFHWGAWVVTIRVYGSPREGLSSDRLCEPERSVDEPPDSFQIPRSNPCQIPPSATSLPYRRRRSRADFHPPGSSG